MLLHVSLAALLLQATPPQQPRLAASPPIEADRPADAPLTGSSLTGSVATDAAGYAVLDFLNTWRTAWLESADGRGYGHTDIRLRDVHCHWDGSYSVGPRHGYNRPPTLIHRGSRRSMCPDWVPPDERALHDGTRDRDAALTPGWRDRIRTARARLIDSLAALDAVHPGDAWITGERVRFLVDQSNVPGALDVARRCTANRIWCAQLTGFALAAAREFTRADSAFDAASAAMTPAARCEWTSARLLLDQDGQSAYDRLSCDQRESANERLWWLSTPLFSDSVDDRRSTDFARKVLVQLHAALPWDEAYDWRSRYGGEAVSEMLVRYGWPAFSAFGGAQEEADHAGWMGFYDSTRTATAEYPSDRVHPIPDWQAVIDPFHAPAEAWQVSMPRLADDDESAAQYWPAEHYERAAGPILQLSNQTVLLRRDTDVLLATASDIASEKQLGRGENAVRTALIRTTAPDSIESLAHETFWNGSAVVITGRLPAKPAVVGTELLATARGELSARTRFGVVPPAPLSRLEPGETAISMPVLIIADDGAPPGPDRALTRMLGSTHVRGPKVGVYWETYGYAPGDSVDVAVIISRHEKLSRARRLGMLLHVAHDINGSVAVRWGEPKAGHDSWTIPGVVPIHVRSVRLDLSRIEPGHYAVEVQVGRRGRMPVVASRDFVYDGM